MFSSTSASLYPVSPPDNTFALPTEVFSSCLAIVSAVTVGGLFLWPALRYGTGYQTVWETRTSAETPSDVHGRRFYFQLTCVHSASELSGRCALQIYLLTYFLDCAIANDGSVRPSVSPSVTLVIHAWTHQDIEINFAPYDRAMFLVSCCQISCSWTYWITPNECVKERHQLSKAQIWRAITWKQCDIA